MCSDNSADAPVEKIADRLLLTRRLGMEIDEDRIGAAAQRTGRDLIGERGEGIVDGLHEDPAHAVDDEDACIVARLDHRNTASGHARGHVERSDEPFMPVDEHQCLALVEGVIAERHAIYAEIHERFEYRLGDPEAASRVLTIDDDDIGPGALRQLGKIFLKRRAARSPNDIADEKDARVGQSEVSQ